MILRYRVIQVEKMSSDITPARKLESIPVLMLSTGYEPLFQTSWKRAITAVIRGRAEVIETHESLTIGTSSGQIPLPIKVRFTSGIIIGKIRNISQVAKLSRKSLFLRDSGECQYCEIRLSLKSCTIDHVIPRSRGGRHEWKNVVLSCTRCNQKKGSQFLKECTLNLKSVPHAPSVCEVLLDR